MLKRTSVMRIRRLFAGVAVGAVCVLVSAHSSVAGYVEVSIVETETAGRPWQTFRQEQEASEVLGQTFRQEQEADKSQEESLRQGQEPDEAQEQEWKQ